MKTYIGVYFSLCLFFDDFRDVANSANIKPTRTIPYIQYNTIRRNIHSFLGDSSIQTRCRLLLVCGRDERMGRIQHNL